MEMEEENRNREKYGSHNAESTYEMHRSPKSKMLRYDDPLVIGAGAVVIGYAIGSGRWNWLARGAAQIAGSLGTLALHYISQSFQLHNPQIFMRKA